MDESGRPPEAGPVVRAGRRHPGAVDALVVLVVCLAAFPAVVIHGRSTSGLLLTSGLIAPLVVRRRLPLVAFGVTAGVALLQWAIGGMPLVADVALLVCFATIAANRPTRVTLVAAAVLEVGVALAVASWFGDSWPASLVFLSGMVTAAGFMGTNVRTRRAYLAHLEDRARRLERERDQHIRLAEAGERARIARELHDVVAHHLTVVITLADAAGRLPDGAAERSRELLATVSATGRTALTEMRRLLGVLREEPAVGVSASPSSPAQLPPAAAVPSAPSAPSVSSQRAPGEVQRGPGTASRAPQPDLDRLDDLVAQVRAVGLPVALTIGGDRSPLPPGVELALYRATQEALTNVLRHATPGSRASVSLHYDLDGVRLRVVDRPGDTRTGAASPAVRPSSPRPTDQRRPAADPPFGNGLVGMRERIGACGGTVAAGPRGDGGWEVRVEVPLLRGPVGSAPLAVGRSVP